MFTVREFVEQAYQLTTPSSPTVPLQGSDLSMGIRILNQRLQSYASTGLMLTISKTIVFPLTIGKQSVSTGSPDDVPTPDITEGRLSVLENAWLILDGVTYPLVNISREEFYSAWKYNPLQSLPRFIIYEPNIDTVDLRLYPAPSQFYQLYIRGKFQIRNLTSNDNMNVVPQYMHLYLLFDLGRTLCAFKGRGEAWTPDLEAKYQEFKDDIVSSSDVNVSLTGDRDSLLNGAWRLRAGV